MVGAGVLLATNPKLREQLWGEVETLATRMAGTAAEYKARLTEAVEEGRLAAEEKEKDLTARLSAEPRPSKGEEGPDYVV